MKLTLLELCQDMLSAIDSENVTDVGETDEAAMCVNIANRCYEDMISKQRWRHLKQFAKLTTTTNKNELVTPSGTLAVDPYNVYYEGQRVEYVSPEDFLAGMLTRDSTATDVETIDGFVIYNTRNPVWFTSDDDETLRFDAIPDTINGLDGNSAMALCYVGPTSRLTDSDAYFDMPSQAFPALDKYCVSMALRELKGDTASANAMMNEYKSSMAALGRNARLVDVRNDLRKWIIPRRSSRKLVLTNASS